MDPQLLIPISSTLYGIALHLFEFRLRDAKLWPTSFLLVISDIILLLSIERAHLSFPAAARVAVVAHLGFVAGLFGSMIVYRLLWHPNRKFPGPVLGRISQARRQYLFATDRWARDMVDQHRAAGDYVRYSPNHSKSCAAALHLTSPVSVIDPRALNDIHKLDRSDYVFAPRMYHSLSTVQSQHEHRRDRIMWAPAFTKSALASYDSVIHVRASQLFSILEQATEPVELLDVFSRFSFTVLADVAFSANYDALAAPHLFRPSLQASNKALRRFRILGQWPVTQKAYSFVKPAIDYSSAAATLKKRLTSPPDHNDFVSLWTRDHSKGAYSPAELLGACMTAQVAGTDTTARTLTGLIGSLMRYPACQARLLSELQAAFPKRESWADMDDGSLSRLPYLEAVIHEHLRLYPLLEFGSERKVGEKGLQLPNGDFLVPGTIVTAYTYALHRRDASFERPDEFLPERWLPDSKLRCDRSSWIPFSLGSMDCIGKALAMQQLRLVLANVVLRFNLEPVDNLHKTFSTVLQVQPLQARLTPRD